MKAVEIIPGSLKGIINPPPSKSLCHRAIIAAALANGQSTIHNVGLSKDILATLSGVQALGAEADFYQDRLIIKGGQLFYNRVLSIDCQESGSTLRFLIPLGLITGNSITYTGKGNLSSRPLGPYLDLFKAQEVFFSNSILPMEIHGLLKPGEYRLRGDISSQFITGLLFALPLLKDDSTIMVTCDLESKSYIDLTIDVLREFGVSIENMNYQCFQIKGRQLYQPGQYTVEADYSQAAFWLSAAALNGEINCLGLSRASKQGDSAIVDLLKEAGAKLQYGNNNIIASKDSLKCFDIDVSQYPDIAPILAVVAYFCNGVSHIRGAARLRIKECDRLKAIATELNKLGADITEHPDSLTIKGVESLHGGVVDSWGDHRIAMSLAVAALRCKNPVTIINSSVVDKSYPHFFEDFSKLGGNIYERNLG